MRNSGAFCVKDTLRDEVILERAVFLNVVCAVGSEMGGFIKDTMGVYKLDRVFQANVSEIARFTVTPFSNGITGECVGKIKVSGGIGNNNKFDLRLGYASEIRGFRDVIHNVFSDKDCIRDSKNLS